MQNCPDTTKFVCHGINGVGLLVTSSVMGSCHTVEEAPPLLGNAERKKSTWEVFLDSVSAGIELLGQLKIFSLTSSHKEILPELPVGPDSVV